MTKENISKKIIDFLEKYHDWNFLEYIFIEDNLKINHTNKSLENKTLIAQSSDDKFYIIDDDNKKSDILNYTPTVDLVIMSEETNFNTKVIDNLIDKHTLITKVLSDNIFFIEDKQQELFLLVINNHSYKFQGHGINIKLFENCYMNT